MPTDVVMPQMGESIFEGTITKWLKKPGDSVQRDEPLFEISTDKVDAEIPSPAAGLSHEIKFDAARLCRSIRSLRLSAKAMARLPASRPLLRQRPPKQDAPQRQRRSRKPPQAAPAPAAASSGGGTDVLMPQMGESIFEGTITKWLKKVGDTVQRDEPLFEISTDKVDAEIPSPAAGTLTEIKVLRGKRSRSTRWLRSSAAAPPRRALPRLHRCSNRERCGGTVQQPAAPAPQAAAASAQASGCARRRWCARLRRSTTRSAAGIRAPVRAAASPRTTSSATSRRRRPSSAAAAPAAAARRQAPAAPSSPRTRTSRIRSAARRARAADEDAVDHCAAHGRVQAHQPACAHRLQGGHDAHREAAREGEGQVRAAQRREADLHAVHHARGRGRAAQASRSSTHRMEGDAIRYNKNINIGIAVALDWGLIVPVLKQAEEKSFLGIARAIADFAERARGKKLAPDEVCGRHLHADQLQASSASSLARRSSTSRRSAILGIGGLNKEPTVLTDKDGNDSIAIRSSSAYTGLRPSHHRWRRRRQVHGRLQEVPGELVGRDRVIRLSRKLRRTFWSAALFYRRLFASSTRFTASSGVSPTAERWPILRPGRGVCFS